MPVLKLRPHTEERRQRDLKINGNDKNKLVSLKLQGQRKARLPFCLKQGAKWRQRDRKQREVKDKIE